MKITFLFAMIYIAVEFIDYATAVIVNIINGTYKSHIAKIGALKKLCVTLVVVLLPTASAILKHYAPILGFVFPSELNAFSYLFISKQIITEMTSILENLGGFRECEENQEK